MGMADSVLDAGGDGTGDVEFFPMDARFTVHRNVGWIHGDQIGQAACGAVTAITPGHLGKSGCVVCGTDGFTASGQLI